MLPHAYSAREPGLCLWWETQPKLLAAGNTSAWLQGPQASLFPFQIRNLDTPALSSLSESFVQNRENLWLNLWKELAPRVLLWPWSIGPTNSSVHRTSLHLSAQCSTSGHIHCAQICCLHGMSTLHSLASPQFNILLSTRHLVVFTGKPKRSSFDKA